MAVGCSARAELRRRSTFVRVVREEWRCWVREASRLASAARCSSATCQGVAVKLAVLHCVVSFVWFAILNYHRKGTAADLKAKAT